MFDTSNAMALDAESLLPRIADLASLVEESRPIMDRERQLPHPLAEALLRTGVCRVFTPSEFGGLELDPVSGLRAIAATSELDGSVGWNAMISAAYSFLSGRLPHGPAKQIYGNPRSAVAGQLQMGGQATVVKEGFNVTGRWRFGSGSTHASWFLSQCIVLDGGKPCFRKNAPSTLKDVPELRLVFVPSHKVEIHDTWHASGLRGTGSHDYSITQVDVPAEFAFDFSLDRPTRSEALYQIPALSILMASVAAVPVGIARAAVDAFKNFARVKIALPHSAPIGESPIVQADLARAETAARSSRLLLFSAMEDLWQTVTAQKTVSVEQRALLRLGCVNAGVAAAEAVDIVYNLAGSSAILETFPFERCFRDVHATTAHHAIQQSALSLCGQALLGAEPQGVL